MNRITARRCRIDQTGGPDVMRWEEVELAPPGPGEVLFRSTAVGLNFIDTYHRSGLYPMALPTGLGIEAAGEVEAVGEGVTDWQAGDRACTLGPALGAYATHRIMDATALFRTPDHISDEIAAAALLKGCTAEFLVERCARVQPGWSVLVHAAAGGVGLLLVQWLKAVGATVVGTVSTPEKAALARQAGAEHVIITGEEDCGQRVRALTNGAGVQVSFDGIGKDAWQASLDATARRGMIVSYGNASGPVSGVALGVLGSKGSLFVTRPTLFDYYRDPDERAAGSARLFEMIAGGMLSVSIGQRYALQDAPQAHRDLEGRRTTGSTLLLP